MKKQICYIGLLVAACMIALSSCYDDKGNYNYIELNDFDIDQSETPTSYTVGIFGNLQIPANLNYEGDESNLEYRWIIYNGSMLHTDEGAVVLSEEKDLDAQITLGAGEYTVEFRATEKNTGRIATCLYDVEVRALPAGMLVLYQQDGQTDCGLICPTVMYGSLPNDLVSRGIYSGANPDRPLTGKPVAIAMYNNTNLLFGTPVAYITIATDNDLFQISSTDWTVTRDFTSLFPGFTDSEKHVEGFMSAMEDPTCSKSVGVEAAVINGTVYNNNVFMSFYSDPTFSEVSMPAGSYRAAPFLVYQYGPYFYDLEKGRMLSCDYYGNANEVDDYDPTYGTFKSIGKHMRYMDYGSILEGADGMFYANAIFSDSESDRSKTYLYVMDFVYYLRITRYFDISAYPGIADAEVFAFARRSPLAYYADGHSLYVINYSPDSGSSSYKLAWAGVEGEEITAIELCPFPGKDVEENTRERYMFVGTYNETTQKGKVYLLRVNIESDGTMQSEPVAVYDGFGRIKDFGYKF